MTSAPDLPAPPTPAADRDPNPPARGRLATIGSFLVTRVPFTTAVVVVMLVLGIATGSLWGAVQDKSWFPDIAYGLPAFEEGKWWTLATGPFFAVIPAQYLAVTGGFALLVGFAEWRMRTWRTIVTVVLGHLVGILGAALLLWLTRDSGWQWAATHATVRDVGFSAGAVAAVAVASATLQAPWRLRLRAVLVMYVMISLFYLGALWDLEHAVSVAVMLPLGAVLSGVPEHRFSGPTRREWRFLAVAGVVVVAAIPLITLLTPSDGPLGDTSQLEEDWPSVLINLVICALLVRGLRKGKRLAWRWSVGIAIFIVVIGALALALKIVETIWPEADIVIDGLPFVIASASLWLVLLIILIGGRHAYRVPSKRRLRRTRSPFDADDARTLLVKHGGGNLSWMTTWPENRYYPGTRGVTYVAYRRHAGVAVGLGDPVGDLARRADVVKEFADFCDARGSVPCFFSATSLTVQASAELGWRSLQVAEDTIVDLEGLEFKGKAWQDVRTALNRAKKDGVTFVLGALADQPRDLLNQVRAISEQWVGDKGLPEMGFTLGGVEEALDPSVRVGLAIDGDGVVQGVTSWMPVYAEGDVVTGWTLDVMRRRTDGNFRPVVEFLIASSCLALRDEGATFISLSGAPLARGDGDAAPETSLERVLDKLGEAMEPYYGFRSLHSFKAKFQPRYEPMYLVYRDEADLPRIGIAIGRAYLPDASLRDMLSMMKAPAH